MPNAARAQNSVLMMIRRWGKPAYLVTNPGKPDQSKRPCVAAEAQFTPSQRASIAIDGAVRFYVAGKGVSEPLFEVEVLEYLQKWYRIVTKPNHQAIGAHVMMYDCQCVLIGEAT